MAAKVDLYNNAYGNYEADVYREIRLATYGEDLGQTSWVTREESREIPRLLGILPTSHVLELGCGSGRYALELASNFSCKIIGMDVNEFAVQNANRLSSASGTSDKVQFRVCDASKSLPFEDAAFDAVFSNDVICHIPGRAALFSEIHRILKPGGKLLFSDALVIAGTISHEEIAARSLIGYYVFTPPGENERLMVDSGFSVLSSTDTTANAAKIASRWRQGRERNRERLIAIEDDANFEGLQTFLACVHALTSERRLLRFVYLAQKPEL